MAPTVCCIRYLPSLFYLHLFRVLEPERLCPNNGLNHFYRLQRLYREDLLG